MDVLRKRPKKVAIVGTANSWSKAPFGDPSWEIWTLLHGRNVCPRWDRFFEIHPWKEVQGRDYDYASWIRGQSGRDANTFRPIYMPAKFPDVPASVAFERERIEAKFPKIVLQCSMAWMFARALEICGAKRVGIWGVHAEQAEEYGFQRPGMLMLTWIAKTVYGCEVTYPDDSPLNIEPLVYGFDEPTTESKALFLRTTKLRKQQETVTKQILALQAEQKYLEGAVDASRHDLLTFLQVQPGSEYDDPDAR